MTTKIVTGTLDLPGTATPRGATVYFTLVQNATDAVVGYVDDVIVVGRESIAVSNSGAFSTSLYSNADIVPSGTKWKMSVKLATGPNPDPVYLDVPGTAGPFAVDDILSEAPASVATAALTQETARATAQEALKVAKAGDTMTGPLVLSGNPASALHAVPKQYADQLITDLKAGVNPAYDTLLEIEAQVSGDESVAAALATTVGGKLSKASNLSDVANAATALANLGGQPTGTSVAYVNEPLWWSDPRVGGIVDGGVADQSAALAAATALMNTAPKGGVLKFQPGEIRLASGLALGTFHGFRMKGAGMGPDRGSTVKSGTTILFDLDNTHDGITITNGTPQGYVQDIGFEDITLAAATECVSVRDVLSVQSAKWLTMKNVRVSGGARYSALFDALLGSDCDHVYFGIAGTSPMKATATGGGLMTTAEWRACAFREAMNGYGADVDVLGALFDGCHWESNGAPVGATPANCGGLLVRKGFVTVIGPYFENNASWDWKAGTENGTGAGRTNMQIVGFNSEVGAATRGADGHGYADIYCNELTLTGGRYITRSQSVLIHPSAYVKGQINWGSHKPTMTDASDIKDSTRVGLEGEDSATGFPMRLGRGWAVSRVQEEGSTVVAPTTALNFVGASVTVTDGGNGTAVITITDATLTTEQVQDIVGALLQDTGVIDVTYNDAGDALTATIVAGSVTNAMLAGSIAYSKLTLTGAVALADQVDVAQSRIRGRKAGAGTGPPQDMTAAETVAVLSGSIASVDAPTITTRDQANTTDTLVLADAGKTIRETNAGAVTETVPPNSSVAFAVGTVVGVYAAGAGGTTIAAGAGVTIRNNSVALVQYQEVSLRKDGTDEWVRLG